MATILDFLSNIIAHVKHNATHLLAVHFILDSPGNRVYTIFITVSTKGKPMTTRNTGKFYFYFRYYAYTGLPVLR